MKTVFAFIGVVVVGMWVYHFCGEKVIKPVAVAGWNASAPYINQAVNKAKN